MIPSPQEGNKPPQEGEKEEEAPGRRPSRMPEAEAGKQGAIPSTTAPQKKEQEVYVTCWDR